VLHTVSVESNVLVALASPGTLLVVDPASGDSFHPFGTAPTATAGLRTLAAHPSTGVVYATRDTVVGTARASSLVTVNVRTGAVRAVSDAVIRYQLLGESTLLPLLHFSCS
jgi:hypothetical protein